MTLRPVIPRARVALDALTLPAGDLTRLLGPFASVDAGALRELLVALHCGPACVGVINDAGWHRACERAADEALEALDAGWRLTHTDGYVQGLTLLGGEPFLNTQVCLRLVARMRAELPATKDVWAWSGYTFEELLVDTADKLELLEQVDVLVDGRFMADLADRRLAFRGSSNQRLIDVPASLAAGHAIEWTDAETQFEQVERRALI